MTSEGSARAFLRNLPLPFAQYVAPMATNLEDSTVTGTDGHPIPELTSETKFFAIVTDLRPDFPPAFWRIRRLVSGLKRLLFPVSISLQIPAA